MADTVAQLVDALSAADQNARAIALAELVRRGPAGAPELRAAYAQATDADVRAQIVQALAEIGDADSAELFAQALGDPDERMRCRGAQGLARIGDARALDALARTIDDCADILRNPFTLSVHVLIGIGPRALHALAPLLKAPQAITRARAILAIRTIASALDDGDRLWNDLGRYDPNAPQAERDRAADLWSEWIAKHKP